MLKVLALRIALQRLVARLEEPVCEENATVQSCEGVVFPTWSSYRRRPATHPSERKGGEQGWSDKQHKCNAHAYLLTEVHLHLTPKPAIDGLDLIGMHRHRQRQPEPSVESVSRGVSEESENGCMMTAVHLALCGEFDA
jgi:hypothetical protein